MSFIAALSLNKTGVPRKINHDDLEQMMDVQLKDGRWVEMSGREALSIFNETTQLAFSIADKRDALAKKIEESVPTVIGSLSFFEVRERLIGLLREATPNAKNYKLLKITNRHMAGHLLRNDEMSEDGRVSVAPLVLLPDDTLVTAEAVDCPRCGGNPHAEYRDFQGNAYDYESGNLIANADQEYVCDDCLNQNK